MAVLTSDVEFSLSTDLTDQCSPFRCSQKATSCFPDEFMLDHFIHEKRGPNIHSQIHIALVRVLRCSIPGSHTTDDVQRFLAFIHIVSDTCCEI